jgi:hypothetical protein
VAGGVQTRCPMVYWALAVQAKKYNRNMATILRRVASSFFKGFP